MNLKMLVSHMRMEEILKEHGFKPSDNTGLKNGILVKNTSFYDDMGIRRYYDKKAVMYWLGY